MKFRLMTLACVLAFTGCANHAARERLDIADTTVLKSGIGATQDEAAGAVSPQWVRTYAPLSGNRNAPSSLQQRLDQTPGDKQDYFHAKAQCWLNAAQQARQEHDQWGFAEEALGQAAVITMGLENGALMSAANPTLRTVSTVRPDLWTIVNAIKAEPATAQCPQAQKPLACAEVELMQAGHDAWRRSFVSAERRLPHVQDELKASAETVLQCKQDAEAQTARVATAAESASRQAVATPRKINLRTDSLFRFDGGNEAAMLPAGRRQLDAVIAGMKQAPDVTKISITGYADRLGDTSRNQRLSLQRAQTVQRYLRSHGASLPMVAQGRGSANPLVECRLRKRDDLVKCLAPNRRVEIELITTAS